MNTSVHCRPSRLHSRCAWRNQTWTVCMYGVLCTSRKLPHVQLAWQNVKLAFFAATWLLFLPTRSLPSSLRFPFALTQALFRHVDHQLVYVLLKIHPRPPPSCHIPFPSETMPCRCDASSPWIIDDTNKNNQQSTIFSPPWACSINTPSSFSSVSIMPERPPCCTC